MQLLDGRLVYSATDLNNALECRHLIALTREVALGARSRPERAETVELIRRKGLEHEADYLSGLQAAHPDLVEISQEPGPDPKTALERQCADTLAAMRAGAPAIYQATFFDGTFLGKADFLLRVPRPSALGDWSYEVVDTKLALHDKPYFIIQLCHYSEHVARVQGVAPLHMHVVLGRGNCRTYRVEDYAAYYRHLKATFVARDAAGDAYPLPCSHCGVCDWADVCEARWDADDHLTRVAGLGRSQLRKFEAAGITTAEQLARRDTPAPRSMQARTFERLHRQARLQNGYATSGVHEVELVTHEAGQGFGLLPPPAAGDLFFDMEGDPFYEIGVGIEYLFGFYAPDDPTPFRGFWGTDREGEKRAFEGAVDFIVARRAQYPDMHVYHYASYEKTKLRVLAQRHMTREEEVDDLLRGEVLIDLYAVVRPALAISKDGYSIKQLESFYRFARDASVKKGDESVLFFERWLGERDDGLLHAIEAYNEEDCRSTWLLREWLLRKRLEYGTKFGELPPFRPERDPDAPCHVPAESSCKKCARRLADEREEAKTSDDQLALLARGDRRSRLLARLASYHRREGKVAWWELFDRCTNADKLQEHDREALGGLVLRTDVPPFKAGPNDRNLVYTYAFPPQEYRLDGTVYDPRTAKAAGTIVDIDDDASLVQLKVSGDNPAAIIALIPGPPPSTKVQQAAVARVVRAYLDGSLAAAHPVVLDLLDAAQPRFSNRPRGARVQPEVVSSESLLATVRALDRSYLFVQGPPGSGKTYSGARVIARLLLDGKRVGVMANTHKAIHNMLDEVERVLDAQPARPNVRGFHKRSAANEDSPFVSKLGARAFVESADDNARAQSPEYALLAGNAWLFGRPEMIGRLDYLFIDEAGQTSLADALAVAPVAANVVLLGDPMQLAQVSQATHGDDEDDAGRSVLQHLLGDGAATVAEDRGVLLDVSYRMEPSIARFISETMYDDRLRSDAKTAGNRVGETSGLRYLPVEHEGNGRESAEEATRIAESVRELLGGGVSVNGEAERPLTQSDILVVTPYNAQRKAVGAALAAAGFPEVAVGTVDKFQGREAPVVFYSMATSSGEDAPRGIEFLFEKNRFNVAISRAQCVSVLVCSPRLLDVRCNRVEQIALVNAVCEYVERATASPGHLADAANPDAMIMRLPL